MHGMYVKKTFAYVSFSGIDQVSQPNKTAGTIQSTYILTFVLADGKRQDITFWTASPAGFP
jgi:hypothetical protein